VGRIRFTTREALTPKEPRLRFVAPLDFDLCILKLSKPEASLRLQRGSTSDGQGAPLSSAPRRLDLGRKDLCSSLCRKSENHVSGIYHTKNIGWEKVAGELKDRIDRCREGLAR
jgi:hypothetical protein